VTVSLPHPSVITTQPDGSSVVDAMAVQDNLQRLAQVLGEARGADFIGTGDPNGVVTASPGVTFLNRAGGAATTFWVKESGVNTNTGWVGK
jgi:hypothetical protein